MIRYGRPATKKPSIARPVLSVPRTSRLPIGVKCDSGIKQGTTCPMRQAWPTVLKRFPNNLFPQGQCPRNRAPQLAKQHPRVVPKIPLHQSDYGSVFSRPAFGRKDGAIRKESQRTLSKLISSGSCLDNDHIYTRPQGRTGRKPRPAAEETAGLIEIGMLVRETGKRQTHSKKRGPKYSQTTPAEILSNTRIFLFCYCMFCMLRVETTLVGPAYFAA